MPTLRKRRVSGGEYWTLYWRDGSGRQRSKSLGSTSVVTKHQAEIALAAKQIELRKRNPTLSPTLKEWSKTYLAWHEKTYPSSHERIRQIVEQWLVPTFGSVPLSSIEKSALENYALHRQAAPATVTKEMRTLQAMLNKAVEWAVIPINPLKGVRPPKDLDDTPPRYFTESELGSIYEVSAWRCHWWRLLANTGLRRKEALQLEWQHIDANTVLVVSSSSGRTKSGKTRGVPLNDAAREALDGIRSTPGKSRNWHSDYVFPRMYPRSLSRWFESDAFEAKIVGTIHDLRHTFCTQLVLRGVHLRKVQLLAGHSTIRITERYAKLADTDLARDIQAINL